MTELITFVGLEIVSPTTIKDWELTALGRCQQVPLLSAASEAYLSVTQVCSSAWKHLCCLLAIQILQEYLIICRMLVFLQIRIPIKEFTMHELWEIILDWKPTQIKMSALRGAKGSKSHWVWPPWKKLNDTAFPCQPLFWLDSLNTGWGYWWKFVVIFFLSEHKLLR